MAEIQKGCEAAETLTVNKTISGVSQPGYPKPYSILNAVGSHPLLTTAQWAREPLSNQALRTSAFIQMVAEAEGLPVLSVKQALDVQGGVRQTSQYRWGGITPPPVGTPLTAIPIGANLRGRTIGPQNTSKPFNWTGNLSGELRVRMYLDYNTPTNLSIRVMGKFSDAAGQSVAGIFVTYEEDDRVPPWYDQLYFYSMGLTGDETQYPPVELTGDVGWETGHATVTLPDNADYIVESNSLGIIEGEMSVGDPAIYWSFRDLIITV